MYINNINILYYLFLLFILLFFIENVGFYNGKYFIFSYEYQGYKVRERGL